MPLSETAATAVTERFQARLADIANRASTVSLRAWEQLGAWDRVDIDRFAAATADAFNAAQAAAVNTSAGYYALLADRPVTVPAVTTTAVTEAPFTAYWHALAEGVDWAEALASGGTRAESIASDLIVGTSARSPTSPPAPASPDGDGSSPAAAASSVRPSPASGTGQTNPPRSATTTATASSCRSTPTPTPGKSSTPATSHGWPTAFLASGSEISPRTGRQPATTRTGGNHCE